MTKLLQGLSVEFSRSNPLINFFSFSFFFLRGRENNIIYCLYRHALLFEELDGEYDIPSVANAKSVRDFDQGLTRGTWLGTDILLFYFSLLRWVSYLYAIKLSTLLWELAVSFGFKSVDDYYSNSSSSHAISDVCRPLLCIQVDIFLSLKLIFFFCIRIIAD